MSHTCDGRDPSCARCPRIDHQGGQVRAILTADDRLDDITRARMWSRIADTIAAPARHGTSARWRRAGGLALGVVAAAATAILVVRAIRARGDGHDRDVTVAADAMLTSRLGLHARAALVGPARLELLGPPGDATTARLHVGTLLAEFEGGPGRSLRIEAGDLVVEIVGTLFAIEVHDAEACVAVAHGTVRVTSRGSVQLVTDRQQLCSGDLGPHAIPDAVSDQLDRHARSIAVAIAPPAPARPDPAPSALPPTQAAPPVEAPRAPSPAPSTPAAVAAPTPPGSLATVTATPRPPTPPVAPAAPAPRAPPTTAIQVAPSSPPAPRGPSIAAIDVAPAPAPPPPPENPAPAAPVIAAPSAETLYHAAEVALAAGDHAAADRALAQILALPGGALVDQALYERARIAYQDRAWAVARRHLATLATLASTPLAEPGRYLDCRIAVEAGDRDAERCFLGYRTAYPRSPHDLDVLAVLVQLAHARAGCVGARTVRDELVTRYPRSDHAAAWRSRCAESP